MGSTAKGLFWRSKFIQRQHLVRLSFLTYNIISNLLSILSYSMWFPCYYDCSCFPETKPFRWIRLKPQTGILLPSSGRTNPTTLCLGVKKTLHLWVCLFKQLLEELYFLPKQQEICVFWPGLQAGTDIPLFLILHKLDSAEHGVTANTSWGKKDLNPMQPQHNLLLLTYTIGLAHKGVFKMCTF